MRPTTANLILFAFASLTAIGFGAGLYRFAGEASSLRRTLLRAFARIFIITGLMTTGVLVWNHLSGELGRNQVWHRAPSFYIGLAILLVASGLWFRQPKNDTKAAITIRYGYPLLVIGLVAGWQLFVDYMQKSSSRSLHTGIAAARGEMAPEMEFQDVDGAVRTLSSLRGKVVLLNFWTTSCGPCLEEMPTLSALQRQYEAQGLIVTYLSPESAQVLADFYREHQLDGIKGRLVAERPVPTFYQSGNAWPLSFLIRRDGIVEDAWLGVPPPEWIQSKIERLL